MLSKTEHMNDLLDWYNELLTKKQKECMVLYYYDDLSLAEIAENLNITRSAVFDALKRAEVLLLDYESKIGCVKQYKRRKVVYEKLRMLDNEDVMKYVCELEKIDVE